MSHSEDAKDDDLDIPSPVSMTPIKTVEDPIIPQAYLDDIAASPSGMIEKKYLAIVEQRLKEKYVGHFGLMMKDEHVVHM